MASRPSGAAIDWLLRPWLEHAQLGARAGRVVALALALIALVLPSMILYYGIDDWWWDASAVICTMSTLGIIAFDALAGGVGRLLRRPVVGLWRVTFLIAGLFLGIFAGYVALQLLTLSTERTLTMVWRDYRRTMGILIPVVVVLVIAGTSLWYRAEAARLQSAATTASFAVLKGQMQPHFLFNSLNALKELIADDPVRAGSFAQRIADLYRLILEVSSAATTSLAHEVAVVDNYLEVEQVRYGERLRYRVEVPAELLPLQVPSLMLQTLAENAVRHGIAKSRHGGEIVLRAERSPRDELALELSNTGAPYAPDPAEARAVPPLGLANTRARLELMYGSSANLEIGSDTVGRTVVRVVIPCGDSE